jgi:hypothetical protein
MRGSKASGRSRDEVDALARSADPKNDIIWYRPLDASALGELSFSIFPPEDLFEYMNEKLADAQSVSSRTDPLSGSDCELDPKPIADMQKRTLDFVYALCAVCPHTNATVRLDTRSSCCKVA